MTSSTSHSRPQAGWIAPAALAVALIAAALAVWTLVRTPAAPQAKEQPTSQQTGGDKASVCTAFKTVRNAVSLQTNADIGPDPVARTAVAANARLATLGGGSFLLGQVNSATPTDLADAVRGFATDLQNIGMKQLAGVPNTDTGLTAQLNDAQNASTRILDLCK